jgi:hypothetical protein
MLRYDHFTGTGSIIHLDLFHGIFDTARAAAVPPCCGPFARCHRQQPPDDAFGERNRLPLCAKHSRNGPGLRLGNQRGDLKMITLKAIALVVGAGFIFAAYSGDLGADVVLAIVACLS